MHPNEADFAARLAELETRFAFQDDLIATLNPQVAMQERKIQELSDQLRQLRNELGQLRAALGHDVADEPPPPHY